MIEDVRRALRENKRPKVTIFPSMVTVIPSRRRGRPRLYRDETRRWQGHAGQRGASWPRCLARGCRTFLKRHQAGYCSASCEDKAVNEALDLLRRAHVTEAALLALWRQTCPGTPPETVSL